MGEPPNRLVSIDLLRGLCAIGVAVYHVTSWLQIAHLYNLGLYGVYAFFVISGASMTLAYDARFERGYSISRFLALRCARLSPLYVVVCGYVVLVALVTGTLDSNLLSKAALNVTFLFALANPGETSIVVGGWSLGIEFIFYLLFPALIALSRERAYSVLVVALVMFQLGFLNLVLRGDTSFADNWGRYTQFGSFAGYFAVGVWIGRRRLRNASDRADVRLAVAISVSAAVPLIIAHGTSSIDALVGVRGTLMTLCTLALVASVAEVDVRGASARAADVLGEASYPLYLLHPIVFALLRSRRILGTFADANPLVFTVVVLAVSFALALVVHRQFERPLLRRAKTLFG
ncbi:acyltransferase family protein [Sandaracinus amylolyticus]|uniref:acyltransferase family protein n=1 Tax=Sandaracinus amylolyticus TaxID=927083 RepID=UPI00069D5AA1|nr:acyltransferase [Sandaracinus amylolyticus]